MAQLISIANTENNKTGMDDFSPLPAGKYPVIIKKSEFKQTKAKTGHYLKLEHVVIDGDHKGKKLWNNLNLDNPNPTAVEIANKTLNTICQACNKSGVQDSEELHGIPLLITVSIKPATPTHSASNDIKFYEPMQAGAVFDQPKNQPEIEGQAQTTNKKLPWEK